MGATTAAVLTDIEAAFWAQTGLRGAAVRGHNDDWYVEVARQPGDDWHRTWEILLDGEGRFTFNEI